MKTGYSIPALLRAFGACEPEELTSVKRLRVRNRERCLTGCTIPHTVSVSLALFISKM